MDIIQTIQTLLIILWVVFCISFCISYLGISYLGHKIDKLEDKIKEIKKYLDESGVDQ